MDAIIRAYDAQIDSVDKSRRSVVARINTSAIDRYHTVIEPRGAKLEGYRKNPVVLWEHGKDARRFTDPIGTNEWIKHNGGQMPTELLAKTRFLDDDFAQQRYEWYRDGVLSAFSIHALPSEGSPPTKEEIRSRPELSDCQFVYRSWELAEYSGTSIPGNADTLTTERALGLMAAIERGLSIPDDLLTVIEAKARTATNSTAGQVATIDRYIRKKGEKWIVYSESGKELGEHDSEEGAKNQLAAIEAHKHDERAWLDDCTGVYIVRATDGSPILSTADRIVAEQCIEAMTERRTLERTHLELIQTARGFASEMQRDYQEFKQEITAYLDLMIHGRV